MNQMIHLAIVDDKRHIRSSLERRLVSHPSIEMAFTACNGLDFIEKLKSIEHKPSHVIMDLEMPEMNGITAIETVKTSHPDITFFVFTVFPDDENLIKAIQAGATGYFLKEEPTENIIEALTQNQSGSPLSPLMAHKVLELLRNTKIDKKKGDNEAESVLSKRESETLKYLVEGNNYKEIAEKMFVSPQTIRTHIQNIYKKLHVNSKAAVIKMAIKKQWFK